MENKKYQIFISSPYHGLIEEREEVVKKILSLYHFPIGMEMFSADDSDQWDVITETIDSSDYYVLVLGHRYGSENEDGVGYTEMEFDYAISKGIPVYAFIQDRDVPTSPNQRDDSFDKKEKLKLFIEKVKTRRMCEFWKTKDELASKVSIALSKAFKRKPQIGWIPGDQACSTGITKALADLTTENNKLREEVSLFREKENNRHPSFFVEITADDGFFFKNVAYDKVSLDRIGSIPAHLRNIVSQERVDFYNSFISSPDGLAKFNHANEIHAKIKDGAIDVEIVITNNGRRTANGVSLEIKMPDGLILMETYDWEDIDKPSIQLPTNPIKKAETEYRKSQMATGGLGGFGNTSTPVYSGYSLPSITIPRIRPNSFKGFSLSIENNNASVDVEKIIHTKSVTFDGIKLIPLRSGKFVIPVVAMCEELESPQHFDINLSIE